jgi:hypothetical protein
MDWFQFIATIIGHIVWPVVTIVLFVILRKHLGSMADRLIELSFGNAKITLDKKLQEGAAILENAPRPDLQKLPEKVEVKPPNPTMAFDEMPKELSKIRHRTRDSASLQERIKDRWTLTTVGAIVSGYAKIDSILLDIGEALGTSANQASSVMYSLLNRGIVTKEIADLYATMTDARNLVVHSQVLPNEREAMEYVRQVGYLEGVLVRLLDRINLGMIKL